MSKETANKRKLVGTEEILSNKESQEQAQRLVEMISNHYSNYEAFQKPWREINLKHDNYLRSLILGRHPDDHTSTDDSNLFPAFAHGFKVVMKNKKAVHGHHGDVVRCCIGIIGMFVRHDSMVSAIKFRYKSILSAGAKELLWENRKSGLQNKEEQENHLTTVLDQGGIKYAQLTIHRILGKTPNNFSLLIFIHSGMTKKM
eukprot:11636789-Ditylum_brightwellii.AAC.1